MKTSLVLCLLAVSCAITFGDNGDEKCKNDFKAFIQCAKTSTPENEREAKKKDLQAKADKCFADAGCDSANWDDDPMKGAKEHMGGMGGGMPDSVKKCLKEKMMKKVGEKLNECLAKHHVRNVDFSTMAEGAEGAGAGFEVTAGGGHGHGGMQGAMAAQFQAVKAVDKCAQKKGGDTNAVKPLEQCLHDVKKSVKPQICAALKPCEAKVSQPCKTRGQEIMKALCQCKKEKEAEISAKLRPLGKQEKVSIQDLLKTVAEDMDVDSMLDDVEKCYDENDAKKPALLGLARLFLKNGGGSAGGNGRSSGGRMGASMSVSGTSVTIMADMLEIDAKDKSECDDCPK